MQPSSGEEEIAFQVPNADLTGILKNDLIGWASRKNNSYLWLLSSKKDSP